MVDVKTPRIKSSVFLIKEKPILETFRNTQLVLSKKTGYLLIIFSISNLIQIQTLSHDNLPITSRSQKKDEDIRDEKDSADGKSCLKDQARIGRSQDGNDFCDHLVGYSQVQEGEE